LLDERVSAARENVPDESVVSYFKPDVANELDDDDDDVDADDDADDNLLSAWIHGGPCITEPNGGWSHWSNANASLACCCWWLVFFIGVLGDDNACCWLSLPLAVLDGGDSFVVDDEFSVLSLDKPLARWFRGESVATALGGGWLK
jgi:hypothetical protein